MRAPIYTRQFDSDITTSNNCDFARLSLQFKKAIRGNAKFTTFDAIATGVAARGDNKVIRS